MNLDVDDRSQSENLFCESEQLFKAIFDEAGAGIALVDLSLGEPVRTNRALQNMLASTEEELSRFATFDQLTYEPNRKSDAQLFRELCGGHRNHLRMEKHFVLKDGRSVWANVIFTVLRDAEKRPRYI